LDQRSVRIKQLQKFLKSDYWLRRYCILSGGVFYFEPPCICWPNFKFLASSIPEIWRGSQQFKSRLKQETHVTPSRPPLTQFYILFVSALVVCLRVKFEVPGFNRSRDMEGSENFKSRSRDPFTIPFDVILHFFDSAACTESVCES